MDAIADWLAIFVIVVVPLVGIAVVLIIHVLPEKIAEHNHHPQKEAIQTLCFLSLVFGGLLWPLAWLWVFLKPLGYRLAYGTDKHDDFFIEARATASRSNRPRRACTLRERETLITGAVSENQHLFALQKIRYKVGSADLRSIAQQQLVYASSRSTLLRVQSEQRIQLANLYLALGGGVDSPSSGNADGVSSMPGAIDGSASAAR